MGRLVGWIGGLVGGLVWLVGWVCWSVIRTSAGFSPLRQFSSHSLTEFSFDNRVDQYLTQYLETSVVLLGYLGWLVGGLRLLLALPCRQVVVVVSHASSRLLHRVMALLSFANCSVSV